MGIFTGQGHFLSNISAVGKVALLMEGDLVVVVQLASSAGAVSITPFVNCLNGLFLSTPTGAYFKVEAPRREEVEKTRHLCWLIILCHHDRRNERRPQVYAFGSAFGAEAVQGP